MQEATCCCHAIAAAFPVCNQISEYLWNLFLFLLHLWMFPWCCCALCHSASIPPTALQTLTHAVILLNQYSVHIASVDVWFMFAFHSGRQCWTWRPHRCNSSKTCTLRPLEFASAASLIRTQIHPHDTFKVSLKQLQACDWITILNSDEYCLLLQARLNCPVTEK